MDRFKKNWILGLIITSYLGVAVSYSKLYSVHFFLLFSPVFLLPDFIKNLRNYSQRFWPLVFWFCYLVCSSLWALNVKNAINYSAMALMGLIVTISVGLYSERRVLGKNFFYLTIFALGLGLIECFSSFRYPISKYSTIAHYFGKTVLDSDISEPYAASFFWTANNFCYVLLLTIPFAQLLKKRWMEILLILLTSFFCMKLSSRWVFSTLIIYVLYRLFFILKETQFRRNIILTGLIGVIFFSIISISLINHDNILELKSILNLPQQQIRLYSAILNDEDISLFYHTRRDEMFYQTVKLWKQSPFLGVGAGQLTGVIVPYRGKMLDISTPHHYWAEILAYGGLVLFLVIFYWMFSRAKILYQKKNLESRAALESLVLFIIVAPVCSTLVYFFPTWLFLGVIENLSEEKTV